MAEKNPPVLQIIDSLNAGGAERVAVNLTNLLNQKQIPCWLCATREEGPLKQLIDIPERYCHLGKRNPLDFWAFSQFVQLIRSQEIKILHAHSSSLTWAVLAHLIIGAKVVWHNHYGNSEFLEKRNKILLRHLCQHVDHVISVNEQLAQWAVEDLRVPEHKVSYLQNFPVLPVGSREKSYYKQDTPVIVCTANLRAAKDHHTLVAALDLLNKENIPFQAWLIGADFGDSYSQTLKAFIAASRLEERIQLLGVRSDIGELLQQADIGVLSSRTEGLPVALLEYGLSGLPVVTTHVGQCAEVVGDAGFVVPPGDPQALAAVLKPLLSNAPMREVYGRRFKMRVQKDYSQEAVYSRLMDIYGKVLQE